MFVISIENYPDARIKITAPDGKTLYIYTKKTGKNKSRVMIEGDKEIKISREYNQWETTSLDANDIKWGRERV